MLQHLQMLYVEDEVNIKWKKPGSLSHSLEESHTGEPSDLHQSGTQVGNKHTCIKPLRTEGYLLEQPTLSNLIHNNMSFQIWSRKKIDYIYRASLVAYPVKGLPAVRETQVQSPGQEDPLEKEMATHSSTLAWKIPRTEEPSALQPMG